jgi:predicted enzyme related to lactoylglutathione lyase
MSEPTQVGAEHDRRIQYVEIPVTDMARAKRFYGEAFGWSFTDWGPEYASFADAGVDGGFRLEAEVRTGGMLVIVFALDLADAERRVVAAGGTIGARHEFPGGRRFHFTDPFGHELAVWSDR